MNLFFLFGSKVYNISVPEIFLKPLIYTYIEGKIIIFDSLNLREINSLTALMKKVFYSLGAR